MIAAGEDEADGPIGGGVSVEPSSRATVRCNVLTTLSRFAIRPIKVS